MELLPLLWSLLALLSHVSAQSILPTNSTPTAFNESDPLAIAVQRTPTPTHPFASLLPLSTQAYSSVPDSGIGGWVVIATGNNATSAVTNGDVVFVPCDPSAYPGFVGAASVVQAAIATFAKAVVLYSTTANYCTFDPLPIDYNFIYTMESPSDMQTVMSALTSPGPIPVAALIARQSTFSNSSQSQNNTSSSSDNNNNNPNGPAPSTAVAMIILYSITGVITALFLIIIITGAVRAHRHPERYGPRNVLGRPRQSRARGLARAMLDTLPIVKFGERVEPKPGTDVELAENASGVVSERHADSGGEEESLEDTTMTPPMTHDQSPEEAPGAETDTSRPISVAPNQLEPAVPVGAGDEGLSCSICTEDFERGQDVRVLPCNHSFHPACIDPWLLNVSGTCPLCRIDLRPSTSHDNANPDDPERRGSTERNGSFAPPLDEQQSSENVQEQTQDGFQRASRRFSGFVGGILNPRRMQDATPQERVEALRQLRERQRVAGETEQEARRGRRLTAMLSDTFAVRTRRRGAEAPDPTEGRRMTSAVPPRLETITSMSPITPTFASAQGFPPRQSENVRRSTGPTLDDRPEEIGVPLETVVSNSAEEHAAEREEEAGRRENQQASSSTNARESDADTTAGAER